MIAANAVVTCCPLFISLELDFKNERKEEKNMNFVQPIRDPEYIRVIKSICLSGTTVITCCLLLGLTVAFVFLTSCS